MKVAVASDKGMVTQHFGHCESFQIYDVDHHQIIRGKVVSNPGHKPGFLPNFLNNMGVNVIISGGMGGGAIDIFNENGIEVITGAQGEAKTAVENYLEGKLKSSETACNAHQHHGEC